MKLAFEIKVLKKVAPELSPRYFLGSATVRMRAPSSHRQVTPPAPGVAAGCSCTHSTWTNSTALPRAPASTEGTPFRSWERGGFVRTGPSGARHVLEVKGCFGGAAVLLWSRARVIPRISGLMFLASTIKICIYFSPIFFAFHALSFQILRSEPEEQGLAWYQRCFSASCLCFGCSQLSGNPEHIVGL